MKYKPTLIIVILFVLLSSCGDSLEHKITKGWSVTKMERMAKPIDIHSKMSYNFNTDHTVHMITQIGSKLKGTWSLKDSTITISVKGERKAFLVHTLTDKELVLSSGEFRFYLEE